MVALTLLASACGRSLSSANSSAGNISPTANLVTTTPAGAKTVPQAVWAVYRDVNSLDPAFAFDYPENTAISLMCESLLLQKADGAIVPGLASLSTPNQKTLVFTINPKATFWDGRPVTPADVVYSLDRQMNPSLGGFYSQVFDRVKTIEQTGQDQVTITLNQPDYWLEGELSSMAGVVIEKAYAQQEGKNYGTPAGGIMCTGPVPAEVLVPQRRGRRRRQPALLAGNDPAGPADHAQRRAGQQRPHRGPGDRRHPGHLRLRRHPHPGSAQEEQRGEGLPGTGLGDRRDDHLRSHRPAGQRQGPSRRSRWR